MAEFLYFLLKKNEIKKVITPLYIINNLGNQIY